MTTPFEKLLPELPEPAASGLGPEYDSFDKDGRPMGKAYQNIQYFNAEQMRAYAVAACVMHAKEPRT